MNDTESRPDCYAVGDSVFVVNEITGVPMRGTIHAFLAGMFDANIVVELDPRNQFWSEGRSVFVRLLVCHSDHVSKVPA